MRPHRVYLRLRHAQCLREQHPEALRGDHATIIAEERSRPLQVDTPTAAGRRNGPQHDIRPPLKRQLIAHSPINRAGVLARREARQRPDGIIEPLHARRVRGRPGERRDAILREPYIPRHQQRCDRRPARRHRHDVAESEQRHGQQHTNERHAMPCDPSPHLTLPAANPCFAFHPSDAVDCLDVPSRFNPAHALDTLALRSVQYRRREVARDLLGMQRACVTYAAPLPPRRAPNGTLTSYADRRLLCVFARPSSPPRAWAPACCPPPRPSPKKCCPSPTNRRSNTSSKRPSTPASSTSSSSPAAPSAPSRTTSTNRRS